MSKQIIVVNIPQEHKHECSVRSDDHCAARGYCKCKCGHVRDWDAGAPMPKKDGGLWVSGEGR
jgi:hypothetical protein